MHVILVIARGSVTSVITAISWAKEPPRATLLKPGLRHQGGVVGRTGRQGARPAQGDVEGQPESGDVRVGTRTGRQGARPTQGVTGACR